MKLYYSKGACSLAVRIVINELGIKCEYIAVDLKAKKLPEGDDYLKINPKGAVPVIETDDKKILTENQVIQQYLADTHSDHKLLPKVPDFQRYRTLEMLNFTSTDIHKGFAPIFNEKTPEDYKKDVVIPNLQKKFKFIDETLEGKEFIMGNDFTLPDAYLFVVMRWAHRTKLDLQGSKNLRGYYDRLCARESIKKSLLEEGIEA